MTAALEPCPACRYVPCIGRRAGCGQAQATQAQEHLEAALVLLEAMTATQRYDGQHLAREAEQAARKAIWRLKEWEAIT